MKIIVLYDSVFGNTEKVAKAIGEALAAKGEVQVVQVRSATAQTLAGAGVVLAGSPTRAFRPTPEMQAFLKNLPAGALNGVKVAAFDTRIAVQDVNNGFLKFMAGIFGYAAKPMSDALVKKGGQLAAAPEGFFVKGTEGPLTDGELERAATWAKALN